METHNHDHKSNPSIKELEVLIKYLVGHNQSHAEELMELAKDLQESNQNEAYEKVISAIEFFKKGNEELMEALNKFIK